MTESPVVSVLTPSLNQGRWLEHNLSSVARQSYRRIEQIVIDGGSNDCSLDVLGRARPNVCWWSEPDRGQSHALNKALAKSSGDIIGWINSDDAYFDSGSVEHAVGLFARHPDVDVVYGHAALVNRDNLVLQIIWAPAFSLWLFRLHNFIIQPTAFIRRSALQQGFVDEGFHSCMDTELWLRLATIGCRFLRANRVLAIDRHYPERKAVARVDLSTADRLRLQEIYRLPAGRPQRLQRKTLTVALRFLGAGLAADTHGVQVAFNGAWDKKWKLLVRQVGVRRSRMPGCSPSQAHGTSA